MSNLAWDHTVHYVNDLKKAEETMKQHGLVSKYGGNHPNGGTHNSLSYFELTYIEFLAIEKPEIIKQTTQLISSDAKRYLPEHEAFSRPALRTDSMDALYQKLKQTNLALSPIFEGSRKTANGELLTWKLLTIDGSYADLPYPFFISWETTDQNRYRDLEKNQLLHQHQLQNVKVEEAIFSVTSPQKVAQHWSELFGLKKINDTQLAIGTQVFSFHPGTQNQLTELVFSTTSSETFDFFIGEGRYRTL